MNSSKLKPGDLKKGDVVEAVFDSAYPDLMGITVGNKYVVLAEENTKIELIEDDGRKFWWTYVLYKIFKKV